MRSLLRDGCGNRGLELETKNTLKPTYFHVRVLGDASGDQEWLKPPGQFLAPLRTYG